VDDYRNEKKEIQARQGKQFPFSFGDVSNDLFVCLSLLIFYFY
jgi:hypothetical protein